MRDPDRVEAVRGRERLVISYREIDSIQIRHWMKGRFLLRVRTLDERRVDVEGETTPPQVFVALREAVHEDDGVRFAGPEGDERVFRASDTAENYCVVERLVEPSLPRGAGVTARPS